MRYTVHVHLGTSRTEELKWHWKNVWDMLGGTSGLEITAGQKTMSRQK